MKEDLNPTRPTRPEDPLNNELAGALDQLLEGISSDAGPIEPPRAAPGECPDPGEWIRLATGDQSPAKVNGFLAHGAACANCAALLRESTRLFSAAPLPEEIAEIEKFSSATPEWQRRLAADLARTPHKRERSASAGFYLWMGAGLAASVALAVGVSLWWMHVHAPEQLLAEAYTHSRSFDLRIPGAGFAEVNPPTHLRGDATVRESAKLLDARSRIEHQLENSPEDARWLQLEARADILEEKLDPAIDILDRLLSAGPVTASLLLDDASAYFERGLTANSQNDRAIALENLRRADELAPGDPVVLFNEAIVMEDRGQVMNAVETWNRYLRFERDPRWLAEGRRRLASLEEKLNRLKTHASRMEQHLATPQAMRDLAAGLGSQGSPFSGLDEELSSSLLPRLLDAAYPMPTDRSRGSPCDERCTSARTLLRALAASLERTHHDPWLTQLLPSASTSPGNEFLEAAHTLSQAIGSDAAGDYANGQMTAVKARQLFHRLGSAAGEDRAEIELSYALQQRSDMTGCYREAHSLVGRDPQFAWIRIYAMTQDSQCDPAPGTASEDDPAFLPVIAQAKARHYTILELRARTLMGSAAVDNGDVEGTWAQYLATIHLFYGGDYPAWRLFCATSALEELEESTPRVQHALLLQREALGVLELSQNRGMIPSERFHLATVALRAGNVPEAQRQMALGQKELDAGDGGKSVRTYLNESEIATASLYLDRRDLASAQRMLDVVQGHLAGEHNTSHARQYALARARLELALGHEGSAESLLRLAILDDERITAPGGVENITLAKRSRALYAVLAGIWLAQGRPGEDVLSVWERYRLRILGEPIVPCANSGLDCLRPALSAALARLGPDRVLGQVVLFDRVLLYQATAHGVTWTSISVGKDELLAAVAPLERATSSPATSQDSVDQAARRVGGLLLQGFDVHSASTSQLLLEPDPTLGNLPWPAVETSTGPLGLAFDLEEVPSLLLAPRPATRSRTLGSPLVVGASLIPGHNGGLPEALDEARAVARFGQAPSLVLADQATEPQVALRLPTATALHFAGHAAQRDGVTKLLLAPDATNPAEPYLDSSVLRKNPPRAAQLAVISACSSGKREEGWNHGMEDIVDTLAALGVPEVVATRWQIDSGSAVPLMDAFYGGLARGLSVPRALTSARQSLFRDARYRHPYYWAAYYASGTGKSDLHNLFASAK
jgi:tetratricopeptide (TPR) repeat protein